MGLCRNKSKYWNEFISDLAQISAAKVKIDVN
jgi:hypothetical protein